MIEAFALAVSSSLPALVRGLRRRAPPSWPWIVSAPLLYALVALAGFALRRAGVSTALYPGGNDDRGFMTLAALAVHGFGAALPALGLAMGAWHLRAGSRRLGAVIFALSLASLSTALYALAIEPATLVVREERVHTGRAPEGGITILHVSDLQTDGPCRRERLAVEAASRELPDFVIFTGDLTNGLGPHDDAESRALAANTFLRGLRARYAVIAVYGDWDAWGPTWPAWERRILEGSNAVMLYNRALTYDLPGGRVVIWGAGGGGPTPTTIVRDMRDLDGLRILAGHHPDILADGLTEGGADLVLAGHTHGGQVVLPFFGALVTHSERGFVGGQYAVKGIPLLVSRGIGMRGGAAPRVRFRCPPEITWVRVSR